MVDESAPARTAKVWSRLTWTPLLSNVLFQCPELIEAIDFTKSKPVCTLEKRIHCYSFMTN
jgi:hypothetical protein